MFSDSRPLPMSLGYKVQNSAFLMQPVVYTCSYSAGFSMQKLFYNHSLFVKNSNWNEEYFSIFDILWEF